MVCGVINKFVVVLASPSALSCQETVIAGSMCAALSCSFSVLAKSVSFAEMIWKLNVIALEEPESMFQSR